MSKNTPFDLSRADLGTSDTGYSREVVTDMLKSSQFGPTHACFICKQPATHRILAKEAIYITAEIQDGLYICTHHLQPHIIDPIKYALRALK